MGRDGIGARGQQPPVVTSLCRGDGVVDSLHADDGVGDGRTAPKIGHGALDAVMDLQGQRKPDQSATAER